MGKVNVKIEATEQLEPLGQMILIEADKPKEMIGGLYVPDTAKTQSLRGIVKAVGRGRQLENGEYETLWVWPGDKVVFTQYYGFDEIHLEDTLHLLVRQQDIIAKITEKGN